jgi:hypothetical protein
MENIVRTWEDVELTDAELENIYGGGFPMTLTGNVLGNPVTVSGIVATGLSLDATGTGTLTTDASTATITPIVSPSTIAHAVPASPSHTPVSYSHPTIAHVIYPTTRVIRAYYLL